MCFFSPSLPLLLRLPLNSISSSLHLSPWRSAGTSSSAVGGRVSITSGLGTGTSSGALLLQTANVGIIGVMVLRRAARASVSVVQYTSDQVHLWWAIAVLCGLDQDRGGAVHMTVGLGNSGSGARSYYRRVHHHLLQA